MPPLDDIGVAPLEGPEGARWLLERIDRKVDQISEKLEHKADREQVHTLRSDISAVELRIRSELDQVGNRVTALEQRDYAEDLIRAAGTRRFTWRERIIGMTVAIVAVALTVINLIIDHY